MNIMWEKFKVVLYNVGVGFWNATHAFDWERKDYLPYPTIPRRLVIDPVHVGATLDWSPSGEIRRLAATMDQEANFLALEEVDMEEVYAQDVHFELIRMQEAVLTDFDVAINRALHRFHMTPMEMLGAAVLHTSGEHQLVRT